MLFRNWDLLVTQIGRLHVWGKNILWETAYYEQKATAFSPGHYVLLCVLYGYQIGHIHYMMISVSASNAITRR